MHHQAMCSGPDISEDVETPRSPVGSAGLGDPSTCERDSVVRLDTVQLKTTSPSDEL